MGKQYIGTKQSRKNNRYKLPLEYTDTEVTEMSPKPFKVPSTVMREAVASLKCDRKTRDGKWLVRSSSDFRHVATLSLRRGKLCYKIMPGIPGSDGKIHTVNSVKRQDGLLAIARKISGFLVEVKA
jgi:hypothetical protein